jgi:hypothetical protein
MLNTAFVFYCMLVVIKILCVVCIFFSLLCNIYGAHCIHGILIIFHVDSIFMLFTVSRHGLAVLASSLNKSYCNCIDLPDAGWGAVAGVSELRFRKSR